MYMYYNNFLLESIWVFFILKVLPGIVLIPNSRLRPPPRDRAVGVFVAGNVCMHQWCCSNLWGWVIGDSNILFLLLPNRRRWCSRSLWGWVIVGSFFSFFFPIWVIKFSWIHTVEKKDWPPHQSTPPFSSRFSSDRKTDTDHHHILRTKKKEMSVPPLHNRCCVPTLDGHYNCPKGHCSTGGGGCCSSSPWKIAIISFLISDILWFLLSSSSPFALLLVANPTHSPGLDYSNYWTEKEVSTGVHNGRVSSGTC